MAQQLQDVEVEFVSLVDRAAVRDPQNKSEPRQFLIWKSAGHDQEGDTSMTAEEMQAKIDKAEADSKEAQEKAEATVKAAQEAQEKAETERDEALEKAKKKPGTDEDESGEATTKSDLPPEVVAHLEKAEAAANERIEKAEKAAADAEEIAKAERDRRVTADFISKAEGFNALPMAATELGPVLKRASEGLSKEDFDALDSLLKAANEQVARGDLYKAVGADVGGSRVPSDAYGEVQQKAAELRKNDPKLSRGEAEALAMKNDPDLQQRYLASVR